MKVSIISVGTRMPAWVQQGVEEYQKRLTRDLGLNIIEVPLSKRSKSQSIEQSIKNEGAALLKKVPPESYLVALDIRGRLITTEQLAGRLDSFRTQTQNPSPLIGGPGGLASSCLERVDESWSLSGLTLPHPLVRVLVTEQLYRAVSILNGHPYHRG